MKSNEELRQEVYWSIGGTNSEHLREKCPHPQQLFDYWLSSQVKKGRQDYFDYGMAHSKALVKHITKFYKKPSKKKQVAAAARLPIEKQNIIQSALYYSDDQGFIDELSRVTFPFTSRYQEWKKDK